jgi:2-oxoglutarate ferredoxin oxidoreductase subunit beta
VVLNEFGEVEVVEVADVGDDRLLVHDERRADPALAFALSRLADQPTVPTPVGVFRAVERPVYEDLVQQQLAAAQERSGPGELRALIESGSVWDVG